MIVNFTDAEREQFHDAVDKALFAFGADGQDLSYGFMLAVGNPVIEMEEFPIDPLVSACRAVPAGEWHDVCRDIVYRWAHGDDQRDWLTAQPFGDVAGALRPWLSDRRERPFTFDPDHPDQPWSVELLPDCWLSLFVQVPSLGEDLPEVPEFVPNKAVAAWGVSSDDLVDAVRARLRSLPSPTWESGVFADREGTSQAELWYLEQAVATDPIPAAWQFVLDEVAPRPLMPGTVITAPARQAILLSYPDPDLTFDQRRAVVDHVGDRMWGEYRESRVQAGSLQVGDDGLWHIIED
ncbi:hypothetical protein [Actinophytocola sp. NPDC049390]|uniref:hypothetical protein n=1 Tax=Actinophytocola sp. NPDC049390 TaxID=3363894 RepID=UPI0037A41C89